MVRISHSFAGLHVSFAEVRASRRSMAGTFGIALNKLDGKEASNIILAALLLTQPHDLRRSTISSKYCDSKRGTRLGTKPMYKVRSTKNNGQVASYQGANYKGRTQTGGKVRRRAETTGAMNCRLMPSAGVAGCALGIENPPTD